MTGGQGNGPVNGQQATRRDCVFFVADKNMEAMLQGFLLREAFHLSLGCAAFDFDPMKDLFVAAGQADPGLYKKASELTRGFQQTHDQLVVMLDAQWDGSPGAARISEQMTADMHQTGWSPGRFAVSVIEPELENWVWSTSPHVASALGWDRDEELRVWLERHDLWAEGASKPADPKAAMEVAMREIRQPRSSAIYKKLAARVSLTGCEDQALARLLDVLSGWFPAARGGELGGEA